MNVVDQSEVCPLLVLELNLFAYLRTDDSCIDFALKMTHTH